MLSTLMNSKENRGGEPSHEKSVEEITKVMSELIIKMEKEGDMTKEKEKDLCQLKLSVGKIEQKELNNYIEIQNVNETEEENLNEVIKIIARKIDIEVSPEEDIDNIYRKPYRYNFTNTPSPILVRFIKKSTRDKFIKNRKKLIANHDVHSLQHGKRIYINEGLSKYKKKLLCETKRKARKENYKYVWVKNSKILIKKDGLSKTIQIKSEKDLNNIENLF